MLVYQRVLGQTFSISLAKLEQLEHESKSVSFSTPKRQTSETSQDTFLINGNIYGKKDRFGATVSWCFFVALNDSDQWSESSWGPGSNILHLVQRWSDQPCFEPWTRLFIIQLSVNSISSQGFWVLTFSGRYWLCLIHVTRRWFMESHRCGNVHWCP